MNASFADFTAFNDAVLLPKNAINAIYQLFSPFNFLACSQYCVISSVCDGFRIELPRVFSFRQNFLEAHWPPNRSILAAPGEVAGAALVGGARETPGSAAAGVGVAAAGEGVGSAARVGSDSKESPISGCQNKSPKRATKNTQMPLQERTKPSQKQKSGFKESQSNILWILPTKAKSKFY